MLGHLKLHTVGDVDLSHSLGIEFGCAGYETEYDNNADGWYDWGMRRFAQGCLWEKNKRWRPFWDASYRCVEFSLRFSQEACNDALHNGHVINCVLLSSCDAMYDFAYLSVRRYVRDSHWSKDYHDGTGIRIFYENPGFYSHNLRLIATHQINFTPAPLSSIFINIF
jgi:hypothetical protein